MMSPILKDITGINVSQNHHFLNYFSVYYIKSLTDTTNKKRNTYINRFALLTLKYQIAHNSGVNYRKSTPYNESPH